ncbi:hypothetical protein GYMLUDRAFT_72075 [Collybiopsis luxurians FD-317 M1]|uniref:RNA helicase n=1 Tax=Collybiopsis luxurians FD-317 M1 TaxID=944289 RepID=A0A0D0CUV9_9AGAR|nr:hypothetical protein GYMLUDRAFT_72075 [Collybiopsis luxurians FD-317 M1]
MVDDHLVDTKSTFSSFSHLLDARILRALADMGFARPTLVQAKAIPLALESKDILARARTGSGKTAAYCIPVLQKILTAKSAMDLNNPSRQATRALILVPTRELSEQVTSYLKDLCKYCEDVSIANAAGATSNHLQRTLLADKPDVVIATPARALGLFQSKALIATHLDSLIIDEADLVLSYGHDNDIRQIFSGAYLPKVYQSFLMSATMTEDVEMLKGLTLRNPAILKLEDGEDEAAHLTQYAVRCSEPDKFLLLYVILKLSLIRGKCIIFVNDVDRSYRVKLFLEQFGIKSCVLNSELPVNSRYHTVQEFNKGVYNYIIATDESGTKEDDDEEDDEDDDKEEEDGGEEGEEGDEEEEYTSTQREDPSLTSTATIANSRKRKRLEHTNEDDDDDADSSDPDSNPAPQLQKRTRTSESDTKTNSDPHPSSLSKSKKKPKTKTDKEYGVTRGIDFIDVACVVNFDLPTSSRSYTHRVGRTARAGRTGISLSFVIPSDLWGKNKVPGVGCVPSAKKDEVVFSRIEREQAGRGSKVKEYVFDMKQVEAFRYRMEDALRSVTRTRVKEARVKELKVEILNSERLKAHFEDNPLDLEYLRHDKPLHPTRVQPHMKHVPKYLMPKTANSKPSGSLPISASADGLGGGVGGGDGSGNDAEDNQNRAGSGFVPFRKANHNHARGRGRGRGRGGKSGGGGRGGGGSRGGKRKADPLKKFGR